MTNEARSGRWRRIASLTRKELRQLLRDKSNLAIGLLLPAVLILIFGHGISLDVRDAPVAVVLEDPSPAAAEVVAGLQGSPAIAPVLLSSMHEAELLMSRREVDAVLRLPADFSSQLAAGGASVQLIVHGADAGRARIIQGHVGSALAQWALRRADRQGGAPRPVAGFGSVSIEQRMWFNEANTSTWYLVPGLIVLIMTLVGAFLTSMVVAREWERGTLEALFVTPVRPLEILVAKLVPYFLMGLIGLAMCLLASRWLFGVPMRGSWAVLLLSAVLYLLVSLGLGLLISSVTKNQFIASQVALLTSFMPAMMLSGFLFDLRNVPWAVRAVGNALPATHFMELLRTVFLAGNVWPVIVKDCGLLAVYAVAVLALARWATRKRLA